MFTRTACKAKLRRRSLCTAGTALALASVILSGCSGSPTQQSNTATKSIPTPAADANLTALLPPDVQASHTVRVASNAPFPPFEMFVATGSDQFTGLDYDLGQAIGAKLGVTFAFTQTPFDGMIPAIQAGKYDLIMAALTVTPERQKTVSFVTYFQSGTGILVKKGNPDAIHSVTDLCGKTAAVQSGAQQVDFLNSQQTACTAAGKPEITVMTLPQFSDAQLALTSGKAAALVGDQGPSLYAAKSVGEGQTFEAVELKDNPGGYDTLPGGIAAAKTSTALLDAVQRALQSLIDDGIYAKVLDKYGLNDIAIAKTEVSA